MFPEIPNDLQTLTAAAARELAGKIRAAVQEYRDGDERTAESDVEAIRLATEVRPALLEHAKREEALAGLEMSEDEEVESEPEDHSADDDEAGDGDGDADGDHEESGADDKADDKADDEGEGDHGSKPPVKIDTDTGLGATEEGKGIRPSQLVAKGGHGSKKGGETYESWLELAEAMQAVAADLAPDSTAKLTLATIPGNFTDEQRLSENMTQNLRLFEPEIMAEMCAPAQPVYDLDCWVTDRRPVRGSLASFTPNDRGAVTIYPSPTLSDLVTAGAGVGIWDNDDDISIGTSNPSAKDCAVIECADPVTYRLYGVWRCLQVQNLLALTFPELVEAYLNRLAAWHARTAEVQLLEAMAVNALTVTQSSLGYGAATSITSTILHLLTLHREQERWDDDMMEAWMPRWVGNAMKIDVMRQRRTDGGRTRVPSDGEISAMFGDVGVTPHFFIDSPSWATAIPDVENGNVLNALPTTAEILLAPRGKYAVLDRGNLSIGVTGNGLYRDNSSNESNNFRFFFENFEGVVDTNSCPAYLLEVEDLCFNGVQIADLALDCVGVEAGS